MSKRAAHDTPGAFRPPAAANRTFPLVLGGELPLAAVLTLPGSGVAAELGVVICAPLGLQNVCTYRPLRTLAERIAERGVPVLRFDWPGYGDSADPPPGSDALELWLTSIRSAVAALRAETGVAEVALVGLRIGASLAMIEAARSGGIARLALLAPHLRGRGYLRELAAFEAVAARTFFTAPPQPPPPLPEGSFETGGFLFSASERLALEAIDLRTLAPEAHVPTRVLIAAIEAEPALERLAEQLGERDVSVTTRILPSLARTWDSSQLSLLPPDCSSPVVDWLLEGVDARPPRPLPVGERPALLVLEHGAIFEQATMLEASAGRIFAVTCEPSEPHRGGEDWVVFLNTGRIRRGGTSRLATIWARRWARAGVCSLRLDVRGVGDAEGVGVGDESLVEDPLASYTPEVLGDVRAALDWLGEQHGAKRFMVIGLCSGATIAYQLALAEPRVAGVGLINTPAWYWDDRLRELNAWRQAKLGGVAPQALMRSARTRGRAWARWALKGALLTATGSAAEVWGRPHVAASLEQLRARGTRVAAIYSEHDFGLEYLSHALGSDFPAELTRAGVSFEVVTGPDHTFRPLWSHAVLEGFLERLLATIGFREPSLAEAAPRGVGASSPRESMVARSFQADSSPSG